MPKPTITQMLLNKEKNEAHTIYLRQPRDDQWHEFSWGKVMQQARQVANFLQQQGFEKGDKISIYSKNCAEWFITDFGITLAGMINVPLFGNQHPDSIHYILNHANVKLVFVGKLDQHQQAWANLPKNITTVRFNYHPDLQTDKNWDDVLAVPPLQDVVMPDGEDLYTIIYTSGTSGNPRGAVYDHAHIANYLEVFQRDILRFSNLEHHHFISYLPLAHVYERTAVELASVAYSSDVSFVESLDKFAENLREIQPTIFTAVPRIWGVFQQKIEAKLPRKKMDLLLKIPFISGLVKKKVRNQLGLNRCDNCVSGASALPVSILEYFEKLGILIQEGYGQTENLAYATINKIDERKFGYVGKPRLEVEFKMGEQQELLMRSNCLMKGYYKEEEATQNAFKDGWLRTGDIGEIDAEGNVKILGRLSETFKNQKGEFITPAPIEKQFATNHYIEHLCLFGRGLPNNVMLVTLTEDARKKDKDSVENSLRKSLKNLNSNLANYEKISHIIITRKNWTPENGILTPTLKVKRREIENHFKDDIQKAIQQPRHAVFWIES